MPLSVNIPFNLDLNTAVKEFNQFIAEIKTSLGKMGENIKPIDENKFKQSLQGIDAGAKKTSEGIKGIGDEAGKQTVKVQGFGKAFQFAAIAQSINIVKDSINELTTPFVKLDSATARIKTLGGESKAMADEFKALSIRMSSDIPIGAADMQTALYDALSAGIKPTTVGIEAFMTAAGKLAVGGGETVGNTVNLLSSITNAYGLAAETAGESSDYLFQTVNLGKTTIPELNSYLSQVIPTAAAAGVNLQNVGASLALMTANGVPTAQATTKLNQLLVELQKGSKDLDPLLKKAGISMESLKNEPLVDNLERLKKAFEESGTTATQTFGSIEAASAFNVLTKDIGSYRSMLDQMNNSTGSTQAAFEEMEKTIENRSAKAKIAFETFVISAIDKSGAFGTGLVTTTKILGEMQAPIMALAALKAVIPTQQIGQLATMMVGKFVPAAVTTSAVTGATSVSFKVLAASVWASLAPMLPFIAAAAAVGVAIYALDGGFKQSAKSKMEDAEAQIKLNKETQTAVTKSRDYNIENLKLINSTTELAKKENLSAEEKDKLKINLDKLHKTYPDVITDTSNMDGVLISLGKSARDVTIGIGQYNDKLTKLQQAYKELRTVAIEAEFEMGAEVFQPGFIKTAFSSAERIAEIKMVGDAIENRLRATKSQKEVNDVVIYATDVLKRHNMMTKEYTVGLNTMITARSKYFKQEQTEISKVDEIETKDDKDKKDKPEKKVKDDSDEIYKVLAEAQRQRQILQAQDIQDTRAKEETILAIETSYKFEALGRELDKLNKKKSLSELEKAQKESLLIQMGNMEMEYYQSLDKIADSDKARKDKEATESIKFWQEWIWTPFGIIKRSEWEKQKKELEDKRKEEADKELADKEAQANKLAELTARMGQAFGEGIAKGDVAGALRGMLVQYLDYIHGIMIATQVEILAKNLATADSIASFGVSGFVKAGLQIAAIEALYQIAKGVIGARYGGRIRGGHQLIQINEEGEEGVLTADAMEIPGTENAMEWVNKQKRPVWDNPVIKRKVIENIQWDWELQETMQHNRIAERRKQTKDDIEFINKSFIDENGKLILGKEANQELRQINKRLENVENYLEQLVKSDKKPKKLELEKVKTETKIIRNTELATFIDEGKRANIKNK